MNPLSTSRNKYHSNIKNSTVFTPKGVSNFIKDMLIFPIKSNNNIKILDPAIGAGNLVKPYKEEYIIGYDIDNYNPEPCNEFHHMNFLEETNSISGVDVIICNPPFNTDHRNKDWLKKNKLGKALLPEVFADKVFHLYPGVPYIMITPMGFLLNQRKKSKRWKKYSSRKDIIISSIAMLPLDIFPNVEFHVCIIAFNFPEGLLKPFYWFQEKYLGE